MAALVANETNPPNDVYRLRQFALGPEIISWCNRVSPKLRQQFERTSQLLDKLIGEVEDDMMELPCSLVGEGTRADEMNRLSVLLERLIAMLERSANIHMKQTAGGQASLWAGYQAAKAAPPMLDNQRPERDVTRRVPLRSGASQVVDG